MWIFQITRKFAKFLPTERVTGIAPPLPFRGGAGGPGRGYTLGEPNPDSHSTKRVRIRLSQSVLKTSTSTL